MCFLICLCNLVRCNLFKVLWSTIKYYFICNSLSLTLNRKSSIAIPKSRVSVVDLKYSNVNILTVQFFWQAKRNVCCMLLQTEIHVPLSMYRIQQMLPIDATLQIIDRASVCTKSVNKNAAIWHWTLIYHPNTHTYEHELSSSHFGFIK